MKQPRRKRNNKEIKEQPQTTTNNQQPERTINNCFLVKSISHKFLMTEYDFLGISQLHPHATWPFYLMNHQEPPRTTKNLEPPKT